MLTRWQLFPVKILRCLCRFETTVAERQQGNPADAITPLKSLDDIPGPKAFPLIGSAWAYLPIIGKYSIPGFFDSNLKKLQEYGKIVKEVRPVNECFISLYDPADIELMFRHEGKYPLRIGLAAFDWYQRQKPEWNKTLGLLISQGEEWHRLRSKVQTHMMKPRSMQAYLPGLEGVANDVIDRMKHIRDENGEVPELIVELYKWALESVSFVALDRRLGCVFVDLPKDSEAQSMITNIGLILELSISLEFSPFHLWKYLPSRNLRKFVKAYDSFSSIVIKYVAEAINKLEKMESTEREMTLLERMLTTKDMTKEEVLVFLLDMMFAGVDTTSHSAAFVMYNLAKNPEAQEKLVEELNRVLPSKDEQITPAVLNELRYLKACMKESLRLNPLVQGTGRMIDHDLQIKGYNIPAGTFLVGNFATSAVLEEYFPEPKKFFPERWLTQKKDFHPFISLPFGFGARSCIGKRLAEQEMMLLLIKIFQNFHIEYHHEDIGMVWRTIFAPDKPMKLKFVDRF